MPPSPVVPVPANAADQNAAVEEEETTRCKSRPVWPIRQPAGVPLEGIPGRVTFSRACHRVTRDQCELSVFDVRRIYSSCKLFKRCSPEFVRSLLEEGGTSALKGDIYDPNTVIVKQGTVGHTMYLIHRGDAEVLLNGERVATLGAGECFGEMHLLGLVATRTATVRTMTICHLFEVTVEVFVTLLKRFRAERRHFEREAMTRYRTLHEDRRKQKKNKVHPALHRATLRPSLPLLLMSEERMKAVIDDGSQDSDNDEDSPVETISNAPLPPKTPPKGQTRQTGGHQGDSSSELSAEGACLQYHDSREVFFNGKGGKEEYLPDHATVPGRGARSIFVRIRTTQTSNYCILSTGSPAPKRAFNLVSCTTDPNNLGKFIGVMGYAHDFYPQSSEWSAGSVNDGEWHLVGVTYDGKSVLRIYIDGHEAAVQTGMTFNTQGHQNILGKSNQPGAEQHFHGVVKDVMVYNRELSACEVAQLTAPSSQQNGLKAARGDDEECESGTDAATPTTSATALSFSLNSTGASHGATGSSGPRSALKKRVEVDDTPTDKPRTTIASAEAPEIFTYDSGSPKNFHTSEEDSFVQRVSRTLRTDMKRGFMMPAGGRAADGRDVRQFDSDDEEDLSQFLEPRLLPPIALLSPSQKQGLLRQLRQQAHYKLRRGVSKLSVGRVLRSVKLAGMAAS